MSTIWLKAAERGGKPYSLAFARSCLGGSVQIPRPVFGRGRGRGRAEANVCPSEAFSILAACRGDPRRSQWTRRTFARVLRAAVCTSTTVGEVTRAFGATRAAPTVRLAQLDGRLRSAWSSTRADGATPAASTNPSPPLAFTIGVLRRRHSESPGATLEAGPSSVASSTSATCSVSTATSKRTNTTGASGRERARSILRRSDGYVGALPAAVSTYMTGGKGTRGKSATHAERTAAGLPHGGC